MVKIIVCTLNLGLDGTLTTPLYYAMSAETFSIRQYIPLDIQEFSDQLEPMDSHINASIKKTF